MSTPTPPRNPPTLAESEQEVYTFLRHAEDIDMGTAWSLVANNRTAIQTAILAGKKPQEVARAVAARYGAQKAAKLAGRGGPQPEGAAPPVGDIASIVARITGRDPAEEFLVDKVYVVLNDVSKPEENRRMEAIAICKQLHDFTSKLANALLGRKENPLGR